MIKIIGCFLVVLTSTLLGFIYSEKFRNRVKQLNELERSMCQLRNEIVFTHTSIPEGLINVSMKCIEPISGIFDAVVNLLCKNKVSGIYEAFKISFNENKSKLSLEKEDINIILDFSKTLGSYDIESEKKMFELAISNLRKQISDADEKKNKCVRMYRYLGFSIGAMVAIVLI